MVMLLASLIALLDKEILTKMKNNRKIDWHKWHKIYKKCMKK
jgi:hypothetical protein